MIVGECTLRSMLFHIGLCCALALPIVTKAESADKDTLVENLLMRGERAAAKRELDRATSDLSKIPNDQASLTALREMAAQYRGLGARSNATKVLERAAEMADAVRPEDVSAILAELGNAYGDIGQHAKAKQAFSKQLDRIQPTQNVCRAEAYVGLLKAEIRLADDLRELEGIVKGFKDTEPDVGCADVLSFAGSLVNSQHAVKFAQDLTVWLDNAAARASASGNVLDESYAFGYLAALREKEENFDEALRLNRKALTLLVGKSSALIYRWQWQIARVQLAQNKKIEAVQSYQQAIESLSSVQGELLSASFLVFEERVLPVYSEYIELLIEESMAASGQRKVFLLSAIQETVESLNRSEILDYFDDDCALPKESTLLASIDPNTVVVYPIVTENRLVSLVGSAKGISIHSERVSKQNLVASVSEFRKLLAKAAAEDDIQKVGDELYRWLLQPIESQLEGIKHLVFVLPTELRTIPMAALYDGDQYLLERFEISVTLGLGLTASHSGSDLSQPPLLGGISESVQGFDALPAVLQEVEQIRDQLGGEVLLNDAFSVEEVAKALSVGGYSIVHLATHGVFVSEASNSYLLAYDDKFSLDLLGETVGTRRFIGDPLDLLVLSACETAAGDNRAALGLAGVSLKAGARSTVASLWTISDAGTFELMTSFYRYLGKKMGKAEALRSAQMDLLGNNRFSHPNYWAPFLLIGNWQ